MYRYSVNHWRSSLCTMLKIKMKSFRFLPISFMHIICFCKSWGKTLHNADIDVWIAGNHVGNLEKFDRAAICSGGKKRHPGRSKALSLCCWLVTFEKFPLSQHTLPFHAQFTICSKAPCAYNFWSHSPARRSRRPDLIAAIFYPSFAARCVRNTSSVSKNAVTKVTIYELAFILCATVARKLIRSIASERAWDNWLFIHEWPARIGSIDAEKRRLSWKPAQNKDRRRRARTTLYTQSLSTNCVRALERSRNETERDVSALCAHSPRFWCFKREREKRERAQLLKGVLTGEKVLQKGASATHTCTKWVLKRRKSPNPANEQGGHKFQLGPFLLAEHDTFRGLPLAFN